VAAGKKDVSAFCLTFGSLVGRLWVSPLSRVMSLKNRIIALSECVDFG